MARLISRRDVQYAFTTKSLFVGHMDYRYLRWQVIDTPGLLDRPLEEFTTIEMQSITALAHLRSAVLYFMDISEQCGYTVEAQCKLFHSIKPLFNNKPVILVINKIDVLRLDELAAETREIVDEIINLPEVTCVQTSAYTEEGVVNVRDKACDALLAHRVEQKLRGNRLEAVANKIHVAMPSKRDDVERPAFIPPAAMAKKKYDKEDPERIRLEKDDEQEMMGKGIFTQDLRSESGFPCGYGLFRDGTDSYICRGMVVGGSRLEVRYSARDLAGKERCRFHRPRYHGEARGFGARRGKARGRGILPERRRGDCESSPLAIFGRSGERY